MFDLLKKKTVAFVKSIGRLLLGLKTKKGLISLFIAFMIFYGWALTFILLGFLFDNTLWMAIGMGVVVFWAAPFTPFFPITIISTLFIQRVILRDKQTQSFKEIYSHYVGAPDKDNKEEIPVSAEMEHQSNQNNNDGEA